MGMSVRCPPWSETLSRMTLHAHDLKRLIIPVVVIGAAVILTQGTIAPLLGLSDSLTASVLGIEAGAIGLFMGRHKQLADQIDGIRRTLFHRDDETDTGSVGEVNDAVSLHQLKERLATTIPSGITAKYWMLVGVVPDDSSRMATLDRIESVENDDYAAEPEMLRPEVALRIVSQLTEIPESDKLNLRLPEVQADWDRRQSALRDAMTTAHFYGLARREAKAGHPIGGIDPARYDVPTEDQVAVYFALTGNTPATSERGSALAHRLRRLERHRDTPLDPVIARRAVLGLLELTGTSDILLPVREDLAAAPERFPAAFSDLPPADALSLFDEVITYSDRVYDSFVGHDGWLYIRKSAQPPGTETIVAGRGTDAAALSGKAGAIHRRWDELKAERSAEVLAVLGDTDRFVPMVKDHLLTMQQHAVALADPVQFVRAPDVAPDAAPDPWAPGRQRLDQWVRDAMPTLPHATVVHHLAAHLVAPFVHHVGL